MLNKTLQPSDTKRLVLMDLNENCLRKAAKRLKHLNPNIVQHNIGHPINEHKSFRSIGINYVLHCIDGSFEENRHIFEYIYRALGIFHNHSHQALELEQALHSIFRRVKLTILGNAIVFQAWK